MVDSTHVLVWTDGSAAGIIQLVGAVSERFVIEPQPGMAELGARVADMVQDADRIVLAGPGTTARQLNEHLRRLWPDIAQRVIGVEYMAKPTDTMLRMYARTYFRAHQQGFAARHH